MKWIKADIEEMELPETEVLAINDYGEFLIGYLSIENTTVVCEDEHQLLPDVAFFIETKNIPNP